MLGDLLMIGVGLLFLVWPIRWLPRVLDDLDQRAQTKTDRERFRAVRNSLLYRVGLARMVPGIGIVLIIAGVIFLISGE